MERPKKNVRISVALGTSVFFALMGLSGLKLLAEGLVQALGLSVIYPNSSLVAVAGTGVLVVMLAGAGLYYINTRWRAV